MGYSKNGNDQISFTQNLAKETLAKKSVDQKPEYDQNIVNFSESIRNLSQHLLNLDQGRSNVSSLDVESKDCTGDKCLEKLKDLCHSCKNKQTKRLIQAIKNHNTTNKTPCQFCKRPFNESQLPNE